VLLFADVRGPFPQVVVSAMLALCVGLYVLEMSGRWDRTLPDTTDEVALVVVVLCVGATCSVTDRLLDTIRLSCSFGSPLLPLICIRTVPSASRSVLTIVTASPPTALRV
jgi:hypothetical protein